MALCDDDYGAAAGRGGDSLSPVHAVSTCSPTCSHLKGDKLHVDVIVRRLPWALRLSAWLLSPSARALTNSCVPWLHISTLLANQVKSGQEQFALLQRRHHHKARCDPEIAVRGSAHPMAHTLSSIGDQSMNFFNMWCVTVHMQCRCQNGRKQCEVTFHSLNSPSLHCRCRSSQPKRPTKGNQARKRSLCGCGGRGRHSKRRRTEICPSACTSCSRLLLPSQRCAPA